jgi:hypothetical protein
MLAHMKKVSQAALSEARKQIASDAAKARWAKTSKADRAKTGQRLASARWGKKTKRAPE